MTEFENPVVRVALYIRVSTEEQALHGLSLEAQREALENYAHEHQFKVVGIYADAGKTARKRLSNRLELQRMLNDVRSGKIDMILFTKLDRWFRNLSDYYKVQEILEANNVSWKTIFEEYDTSTSNGRLHVNIMLSVAQDEADRTSERIKAVFESKVARGEPISGSVPIGYRIEDKRLVVDEATAHIPKVVFDTYYSCHSISKTAKVITDCYGVPFGITRIKRILTNKTYIGIRRGVEMVCPALVTPKLFYEVGKMLERRSIEYIPKQHIYIFSGLLYCKECNHTLKGATSNLCAVYRCSCHFLTNNCSNNHALNESKIERYLLNNLRSIVEDYITTLEAQEKTKPMPTINKPAIRKKMERLKELYINELIDIDTYRRDFEGYTAQLNAADAEIPKVRDLRPYIELLESDFETAYQLMDREGKRLFWRKIISRIVIDGLDVDEVILCTF